MQYASCTINNVANQRGGGLYQEPIGATNDTTPDTLANGTVGGGFAATDTTANFELGQTGISDGGKASLYVVADVDVPAGSAAVTVAANHITVATGGTYTAPHAFKAGQYGWVHLT